MRHCLLNLLLVCCSFFACVVRPNRRKNAGEDVPHLCGQLVQYAHLCAAYRKLSNDSLTKISTWYETIAYPGQFRIDFGDPAKGNATLFLGDSVFTFRKGALLRKDCRVNDLIFLLGGMYFHPLEKVKTLFKEFGFDLSKGHETTWKRQSCLRHWRHVRR